MDGDILVTNAARCKTSVCIRRSWNNYETLSLELNAKWFKHYNIIVVCNSSWLTLLAVSSSCHNEQTRHELLACPCIYKMQPSRDRTNADTIIMLNTLRLENQSNQILTVSCYINEQDHLESADLGQCESAPDSDCNDLQNSGGKPPPEFCPWTPLGTSVLQSEPLIAQTLETSC